MIFIAVLCWILLHVPTAVALSPSNRRHVPTNRHFGYHSESLTREYENKQHVQGDREKAVRGTPINRRSSHDAPEGMINERRQELIEERVRQ